METEEKTHRFPSNQPIDCRGWSEFTIVENTMRGHRIRFVVEIDKPTRSDVECGQNTT